MSAPDTSSTFELRHAATDRATIVVVPRRRLFVIDGVGEPTASGYRLATETLRSASEALRRRLRAARVVDPGKALVETAWWTHPELEPGLMAEAFADRSAWHWQQLVEIPERATPDDEAAALDEVRRGAGREAPLVRVVEIVEGRSAQILNLGSATEAASVKRLAEEIASAGLRPHGHLHQIFLSDPEATDRARARSILRLPIEA